MAISTYAELQTAVGNWLNRGDLAAVIPDFISLCEAKINRTTRLLQAEAIVNLSTSTSSRLVAFPSGMQELLDLSIVIPNANDSQDQLTYISPDRMTWEVTNIPQQPELYTIRDKIELNSYSDQVYALKAHIRQKWDIASSGTNWLLTNYPDIYLYGSLAEAAPYIKDDARIGIWQSLYAQAVGQANESDSRSRVNGPLVVDVPVLVAGRFDIYQGA